MTFLLFISLSLLEYPFALACFWGLFWGSSNAHGGVADDGGGVGWGSTRSDDGMSGPSIRLRRLCLACRMIDRGLWPNYVQSGVTLFGHENEPTLK